MYWGIHEIAHCQRQPLRLLYQHVLNGIIDFDTPITTLIIKLAVDPCMPLESSMNKAWSLRRR